MVDRIIFWQRGKKIIVILFLPIYFSRTSVKISYRITLLLENFSGDFSQWWSKVKWKKEGFTKFFDLSNSSWTKFKSCTMRARAFVRGCTLIQLRVIIDCIVAYGGSINVGVDTRALVVFVWEMGSSRASSRTHPLHRLLYTRTWKRSWLLSGVDWPRWTLAVKYIYIYIRSMKRRGSKGQKSEEKF